MPHIRDIFSEAAIVGLFAAGWGISKALGRRWTGAEVVVLAVIGLLFELLTAKLWHYHHIIFIIPTTIDNDISATFPFAWAGLVMAATSMAEWAWRRWSLAPLWKRQLALSGAWFLCGLFAETLFYNIGVIEYTDPPGWRLIPGQFPPFPPTNFIVGYALVPPFFSWLMLWLESGLRGG
ncbi:MAG: hypothetical protein KGL53_15085 [Elusimicrobia bacterium]|nr:hypothetical protein [Elusimicrobiota bacterium]